MFCFLFLLFFVIEIYPQSSNTEWLKGVYGTVTPSSSETSRVIGVDSNKDVVIVVNFTSDTLYIDNQIIIKDSSIGSNYNNVIIKYDSSGVLKWARHLKCVNGSITNLDLKIDNNDDIVLAGRFSHDSLCFGSICVNNEGNSDIYILKISSTGNLIWLKSAGGSNDDYAFGIAIDSSNDIYITGYITMNNQLNSVKFDTITFNYSLAHNGKLTYLAKYSSNGNINWVRLSSNTGSSQGINLDFDSDNYLYLLGVYGNGMMSFGNLSLPNSGNDQVTYIIKFDTNGFPIKTIYSTTPSKNIEVSKMCIKGGDNIYIVGDFYSSVFFGSNNTISTGLRDAFIVKLDTLGDIIWSQFFQGKYHDILRDIDLHQDKIVLSGYFSSDTLSYTNSSLNWIRDTMMFNPYYCIIDTSSQLLVFEKYRDDIEDIYSIQRTAIRFYNSYSIVLSSDFIRNPFILGNYSVNNTFFDLSDVFVAKVGFNLTNSLNYDPDISEYSFYPNPTSGRFKISYKSNTYLDSIFHIYNSMGIIVHSFIIDHNVNIIDLPSSISNGIYYISAQDKSSNHKILLFR